MFLLHALSYPTCFARLHSKPDRMKPRFEPGLIPCAVSLCERSQMSLSPAALSGEMILLYLHLATLALSWSGPFPK